MMAGLTTIAAVRRRRKERVVPSHPLDVLEPVQITSELLNIGYSPRTAANAAEIAYSVAASLRTGRAVPPRWGWGD